MLLPKSLLLPPRYVEYTSAEPAALSLVTKTSGLPLFEPWKGLAVGKSLERVYPVTYALPAASTAMPKPSSMSLPPR